MEQFVVRTSIASIFTDTSREDWSLGTIFRPEWIRRGNWPVCQNRVRAQPLAGGRTSGMQIRGIGNSGGAAGQLKAMRNTGITTSGTHSGNGLSLGEQSAFLEKRRLETLPYLTDEHWSDRVEGIRWRDPKYRQLEQ